MKKYLSVFFILQLIVLASCTTDADDEWNASSVCPESKRGTFVDERDGQVYKYTTIGKQVWMAQNLSYNTEGSLCYYDEKDCGVVGRVYSVENALCPAGWHVPSEDEWKQLFNAVGGDSLAKTRLRATYGWNALNPGDNPNGTDDCGFGVIFANSNLAKHNFDTSFLTSSMINDTEHRVITFYSYEKGYPYCGMSCGYYPAYLRCVKD